ncbi:hypothetical protein AKJ45_03115 [candidate division MSBL1 archaeon SCGC-AAA261F19]|uniref:Uncharacterized protein n=6 Tax=candidate division MSBL1 TaxID=215777 RepID=A0A133V0U4_9EURY|nr:hypothetical protein AKJ42_01740 [candidate division MSBL1 archaeon SCGC-AAA261C02]KXB02006.1 hypothetical protein AKJ43_02670 [candidate division MSBL1 archaeon SCGC-AAA261D19]KXB02921.1 hypothetical protein AKJ45_03115 [candidate division MSBL1 archaeon SCGC-AAA261F19]KXB03547.1 hypothetical protein AKJ47_02050 [candidate division MSBL1 archaeon SCGC-AAA261G05]KXB04713.1 hypothetical protein AKJ48_01645 [candidate division MSBL1 archaeon SCGC-AAA261O19]
MRGTIEQKVMGVDNMNAEVNGEILKIEIKATDGFDFGTSNEMEYKCKNCKNPISVEDGDVRALEKAVRVQRGGAECPNSFEAWWFCDMECFTKYCKRKVLHSLASKTKS